MFLEWFCNNFINRSTNHSMDIEDLKKLEPFPTYKKFLQVRFEGNKTSERSRT